MIDRLLAVVADDHAISRANVLLGVAVVHKPYGHEFQVHVGLVGIAVGLRLRRIVINPLIRNPRAIDGNGFIVPEVGRLLEFLEFLNLRDRFG